MEIASKKRILVVDDEPVFAELLKANLEETGGYTVQAETRGPQAVAAARRFQPDLILLDVIMPDMSGGEVAQLLRDDPALRQIPVVFLTAIVSRDETDNQARVIGSNSFLAKPASAGEIIACIEQRLGRADALGRRRNG